MIKRASKHDICSYRTGQTSRYKRKKTRENVCAFCLNGNAYKMKTDQNPNPNPNNPNNFLDTIIVDIVQLRPQAL